MVPALRDLLRTLDVYISPIYQTVMIPPPVLRAPRLPAFCILLPLRALARTAQRHATRDGCGRGWCGVDLTRIYLGVRGAAYTRRWLGSYAPDQRGCLGLGTEPLQVLFEANEI